MADVVRAVVWKLARRHTWGSPIPVEKLIRLTARTEDFDEMERIFEEEVLQLSFVERSPDGVYIPNGQDTHVDAANWF